MRRRSSVRTLLVAALLASIAPIANSLPPLSRADAAAGNITGTVYNDKNSDGVNNGSDSAVGGVEVKGYDSTGTLVGTTTTAVNGTYTLAVSGTATNDIRVEFTTPTGYQPSFAGTGNATSIQFTTIGSSSINFAVERPGDYCANMGLDPLVVSACQRPGIATNTNSNNPVGNAPTLAGTRWSGRQTPQKILKNSETGAVWGIAAQSNTGSVWTSAVLRRHSGLGPQGLGGLYVSNPATGLVTSFDLSSYMTLSSNNAQFSDSSRGFRTDTHMSVDTPGFGNVGKVGIGDIDFSPDGTMLYVMNLYERKIYVFPVGGTANTPTLGTPTSIAVTDPGCANSADIRPWGLKITDTDVYAGVICSNETASSTAFTAAIPAGVSTRPSGAYIRKFTLASSTWSTVKQIPMTYARGHEAGCDTASNATATFPNARFCETAKWHAWTDNYSAIKAAVANARIAGDPAGIGITSVLRYHPEPIFASIELLADGSIVAGFADRFAMQMGWENVSPTGTLSSTTPYTSSEELVEGRSIGDTLLVCDVSGTYTVESDGTCGSRTAPTFSNARLNAISGYKEFFDDNLGSSNSDHVELSQGATAIWPLTGTQNIAMTAYDPGYEVFEGGVRWLKAADGTQQESSGTYYATWYSGIAPNAENQYDDQKSSFGKSAGMADLELVCDQAPVQIGNRVWIDTDRDGIQDAGETPVAGVTVRLYNASGTLVGTAITDAQGRYYFSSNVSEAAAGNGDSAGGGLTANASFTVKLDNNADFATGGPLVGYTMTNNDQTNAQSSLDDSIDSDAVKVSWKPEISVSPRLPGVNDHTFDVGFNTTTSPARLGNYVWYDENSDGLQTSGERPVSGVTLNLTDLSGNPVVDVSGNVVGPTTTDADGRYLFSNLHPGSYKVVITYPTGMQATTGNAGSDTSLDSSTSTATSAMLAAGGEDLTLDFGIVPTNGWTAYNATTTTSSTSTSSTSSTVAPATASTSTTVAGGSAGTTTTSPTTSSIPPATVVDGGVSVGNYVWIDLNKDGIQDAGEPGIAGVKLTVRDSTGRAVTDRAGKPVEPTYTDASGYYYFSNLPVGRYEVFITYPKGYTPTKTGSGTATNDSSTDSALSKDLPTPGMKDYTLDFGVIPSAVIEEPIWVDTNGDGFLSSGEKLVPGADVIILNEDGSPAKNLRDESVTPVRTQDDGSFTFKDLAPGKYKVVVVYPEGYTAGLSNASSVMFTTDAVIPPSAAAMSSGKVAATPKSSTARKVTPVVSIGNLVWFDLDKDGFQDPAERGVSGATLTAFKADGKTRARDVNGRLVSKQTTSRNGRFLFTNLPPGGYVVKIVYPAGYRATIAKSAGRAKNSSTDVSKSLVLAAGESDMTLDFGLVRMPITRLPATL